MVHNKIAKSRPALVLLLLLLLIPGALAFTVSPVVITPAGVINPNDEVTASATVYAAYGTAFPSYDDIQFVTELDDAVWSYTILVNGIENVRPADRGKILTISGFELNYQNRDEVNVDVILTGRVPATAPLGSDLMVLRVQELDSRSNVLQNSVVRFDHLIGQPTPTPTPAYGTIRVTSEPAGATVFLDNAIKGITPMSLEAVPNGEHTVLVRLDGYYDHSRTVTVTGDTRDFGASLEPVTAPGSVQTTTAGVTCQPGVTATVNEPARTGTLSVTTNPPGALVYIDDEMKGITPAIIPGLSPGSHAIHLMMEGYEDFRTSTEITAGTTSEFVTGLSPRKQLPGFTLAGALLAVGLAAGLLHGRIRRE